MAAITRCHDHLRHYRLPHAIFDVTKDHQVLALRWNARQPRTKGLADMARKSSPELVVLRRSEYRRLLAAADELHLIKQRVLTFGGIPRSVQVAPTQALTNCAAAAE